MPIYEQSYRRYEARQPLRRTRFLPITREALKLILARKAFLVLWMFAWVPFIFRVIQVWVVTQLPQVGRVLPTDGRLFGEFLNQQGVFTLLLSVFGGAGLIANDLRTGAILVYLSRPLTRRDYVVGKLGVLLALNLSVTLLPGLLLYAVALGLAPDQFAQWSMAWVAPAIVLHSFVVALSLSLAALAVSSLSRSARVAGLGFFGLLIGLGVVQTVLRALYRRPETSLLSLQANLEALARALFGLVERGATTLPWTYPAAALLVFAGLSLFILRRRVRAVEIVR
ncbi:MAG TPA: ABC transporter permease subunit [Vicinamibacteria bacterium]|nr:ABC transporter permease subunit [Vicinamibacteria bacterium]